MAKRAKTRSKSAGPPTTGRATRLAARRPVKTKQYRAVLAAAVPEHRPILRLLFRSDLTLEAIARRFGLSRQRVHQIWTAAGEPPAVRQPSLRDRLGEVLEATLAGTVLTLPEIAYILRDEHGLADVPQAQIGNLLIRDRRFLRVRRGLYTSRATPGTPPEVPRAYRWWMVPRAPSAALQRASAGPRVRSRAAGNSVSMVCSTRIRLCAKASQSSAKVKRSLGR
jgi:transcriptional regulator with XRE-family HTH domain